MANNTIPLKTLLERTGLELTKANRYFKIHTTVTEMLRDRGFIVREEEVDAMKKLQTFVEYIYHRKIEDDLIYMSELLEELLRDKLIVDEKNNVQVFLDEHAPQLVESLNPTQITEKLMELFKVSSKQVRILEEAVSNAVTSRRDLKSIESLNRVYKKPDGEKILTFYFYNSEDSKKDTKRRVNDVILEIDNIQEKNPNLKNILFISESKLNTQMVDDLRRFSEKMQVTMFLGDYLLFNCTKHFLVPKHVLLSEDQKTQLVSHMKDKNILSKFPKIFDTDPIARYFGAKPGQVFKIERDSLYDDTMVKKSEFYRYVVAEVKK
jgi:DNA-directed RNA polymerase I, II, and III subunit RPABC1